MTSKTEPAARDNTASDEESTFLLLKAARDALTTAIEQLETAASISLQLDPAATKILKRLARQAGEINQIFTASAAIIRLQHIQFVTRNHTPAPAPKPPVDATATAEWLHKFPPSATVRIDPVFPGEYRIGYEYKNITYRPGFPHYYPINEALQRCYEAFTKQFPTEALP